MDARIWPPYVDARKLPEVASMLGISDNDLLTLIARQFIAVCTRKPLPVGQWMFETLGFSAGPRFVSERAPFTGVKLARLGYDNATECVVTGSVHITWVHEEPRSSTLYVDDVCKRWDGPSIGVTVLVDDLLISQVEFENFTRHFFGYQLKPAQERPTCEIESQPTTPIPKKKSTRQEQAVLDTLRQLGYDPEALPPLQPGRNWVKAEVRVALAGSDLFTGITTFDSAWERLRRKGRKEGDRLIAQDSVTLLPPKRG